MTVPRLTRRDVVVVAVTALVCFAIAIPLTSASSEQAQRQFTVWPGSSARFANMDLVCRYDTGTVPGVVQCHRESALTGPNAIFEPTVLSIALCKAHRDPPCRFARRWVRTVG